jgi:hypothetical protein
VIVFVPWFLLFVLQVGRDDDLSPGMTVAGMAIGAALLMTYYYPFFIGSLALAGLLAARRAAAARGISLGPRFPRRAVMVVVGTAVMSAVYWLPLLVSIVTTAGAKGYQNRYLDPTTVDVPLPFLTFDLVGFVLLFGLVCIVISARRSAVSMGLLALLGGAYLWVALGYVGILVDVPLLTVKAVPVIEYALMVGAGVGAVTIGRRIMADATVRHRLGTGGLALALGGLAVVVALGLGQDAVSAIPYVKEQREAVRPARLLTQFARATHGRYDDTVVLTDVEQLPELLPVFVFNVWNAHYANPASEFDDRARFLERLSREDDPTVVAAALARNRYDTVASIAFRTTGSDRFAYAFLDDAFPRGVTQRELHFSADQFGVRYFRRVDGSELTVFLPRAGDPARDLDRAQRRELHVHFAGDLVRSAG